MRLFTVLTLTLLPLVLLCKYQGASALAPDNPVQIRLSKSSKSCSLPVITTRSVRFYSVKTSGGSLYFRHLISQALLNCFQVAGGAVIETARDFATCANTAEKKKKNVFHYVTGVCTTYAAMPPSALLPPCSGVDDAVVYVVKTALNSATLPVPKVTNLKLNATETGVVASWSLQDTCNVTHQYRISMPSVSVNKSALTVSPAGNSVSTVTVTTPGVDVITNQTTYAFSSDVAPCVNVTVTPLDASGRVTGTSITVGTATLGDSHFHNVTVYYTIGNITITWNFLDCNNRISAYNITYMDSSNNAGFTLVNNTITSLTLIGNSTYPVCKNIAVAALGSDNSVLGTVNGPSLPVTFNTTAFVSYTLDNVTVAWSFCDCELKIAAYQVNYENVTNEVGYFLLNSTTTSLTILGIQVCSLYNYITVTALDDTNGTLATSNQVRITNDRYPDDIEMYLWPGHTACSMDVKANKVDYNAAAAICQRLHGELFKYGSSLLQNSRLNYVFPLGWVDVHYSMNNEMWMWGNGDGEPSIMYDVNSNLCQINNGDYLYGKNCTFTDGVSCYRFY